MDLSTGALTGAVLIAFAANSVLTRLALGAGRIDAATFTCLRLTAGAAVLWWLNGARGSVSPTLRDLAGATALFAYAVPFSFAYVRIGASVGALVLFGAVQLTMIGYGILRGERPAVTSWFGLTLAGAGLVALAAPSATRPDITGLVLMIAAGAAWGVYSIIGRTSPDPVAANSRSFIPAAVLSLLPLVLYGTGRHATLGGLLIAIFCGGGTSALGYVAWYRAVARLTVMQAAVAQLSVPVIAAIAGVVFLDERLTVRIVLSAAAVIAGVALVLTERYVRHSGTAPSRAT